MHRIYFVFCKQTITLFIGWRLKKGLCNTSTNNNNINNFLYTTVWINKYSIMSLSINLAYKYNVDLWLYEKNKSLYLVTLTF